MRLSLVDQTTVPANKPPADVLAVLDAVGTTLALYVARAWGDNLIQIMHDLDGYPILFVDDLPEAPGALAYHDNSPTLGPYSKVGVGTILGAGGSWLTGSQSVADATLHELLEVAGDPLANRWADKDANTSAAQELCDAVENTSIRMHGQATPGGPLVDVDVPNFVLPSYFNPYGQPPYDALHKCPAAFDASLGYAITRTGGTVTAAFADGTPDWLVQAKTHVRSRYARRGGIPHDAS